MAINVPEQVRKDGNFYKYLKFEQEKKSSCHFEQAIGQV